MSFPIKDTDLNVKLGLMDGVPAGVYEDLKGGKKEIDLATLPQKVVSFVKNVTDNKGKIFYDGKSFFRFHCGKRRYRISYVFEEIGSCGWKEKIVSICEVCGGVKKKEKIDLSGIPF